MYLHLLFSDLNSDINDNESFSILSDDNKISKLEIPTGNPLVLNYDNKNLISARYLDKERAKDLLIF